jgi:hypothetical protein
MVAAGLIWAAVAWASTNVTLRGFSEGQYDVSTIPNNVNQNYQIGGEWERIDGVSLQRVLTKLDVDPDEWTRIFVAGIEIRSDEVFSGDRVPVFDFTGPNDADMRFIRPKKGDDPAQIERSDNSGLTLNYRAAIDIDPDEIKDPETGDEVTFTANIPNGGPSSNYTFNWTAPGKTATGPKFEYTLPSTAGRVQINVEATRSGNIVAEQTIGTPVKAPPPENNGGSGGFGGTGGFNYNYTSPSPDFDYNFPDSGGSTSPRFPETPKTPDPDESPPLAEFGTSVEGELLSAIAPLPPSSGDALPPDEEPPPDPEAAIEEAEEINAPGALIAAGVVVGLLGLGAGREMETVRPRRPRRPNLSGLRRLSPPWK